MEHHISQDQAAKNLAAFNIKRKRQQRADKKAKRAEAVKVDKQLHKAMLHNMFSIGTRIGAHMELQLRREVHQKAA